MKLLIVFATIAAVAVAVPVQRSLVTPILAGAASLVDENGQPIEVSIADTPIAVGPAIIEANPIAVGPAFIDFPLPDGGAVTAVEPTPVIEAAPVQPSPVVVGEIPAGASAPLVQIIVNVNQPESAAVVPAPAEAAAVEEVYVPGPVNVVDNVVAEIIPTPVVVGEVAPGPVNVVDNVESPVVEPVVVLEPAVPGPVNVVDNVEVEPIVIEPVIVGTPIIPAPAVVLPDQLN